MRIRTGGLAAATAVTCLALSPAAVHAAPFPSGGARDARPVWGAYPPQSGLAPDDIGPRYAAPDGSVDDRGPRNILVVQNMRDPATPIAAGVGTVHALGRRAALVTADFGGHGAAGHQECATAVGLTYLVADHRHLPDTQTCPAGA